MPKSASVHVRHAVLVLCAAMLAVTGCGRFGDGLGAVDRSRLINDMSAQLERGEQVAYHAEYQLAGAKMGYISQDVEPGRVAFEYPTGRRVISDGEQITCVTSVKPARCKREVTDSSDPSPVEDFAVVTKRGLLAPVVLQELLRVAESQPAASVSQHDTTIVGQQATCLSVAGLVDAPATDFVACVSSDGVLASFAGSVGDIPIDQALTRVVYRAPESAFTIPTGAKVADKKAS